MLKIIRTIGRNGVGGSGCWWGLSMEESRSFWSELDVILFFQGGCHTKGTQRCLP